MKYLISHKYSEKYIYLIVLVFLVCSCGRKPSGELVMSNLPPRLDPDYTEVTIPPNIAPMNFIIKEKGTAYFVKFSSGAGTEIDIFSRSGKIRIPQKKWKQMLQKNTGKEMKAEIFSKSEDGKWLKFKTITNKIAVENIDPYLYYRLLYPGYESWAELSISWRNLDSFKSQSFIENSVVDENCVNCHSFNNGRTDDFLFHMRGTLGGTYIYSGGEFRKINLKTKEMKNGAVYPRWHPSGKYVAFSSNKIIQRFHAADNKKVEVSDLESSLVLYDVQKNEIMNIELADKEKFMDTYPEWSPDGRILYFCRAAQVGEQYDYKQIRYNLYRVSFDPDNRSFGQAELVWDAALLNKSVSFPRISPDGKYLVVTLANYGCFPIWHKEADLYSFDLENGKPSKLGLNSDFSDSYHSWSSNSRWLVFSSKRGDGLTARPYISYIGKNGISEKPFVLPQRDPEFYNKFLKSYNIPEFSTFKVKMNPGEINKTARTKAIQAKWYKK
jgi:Tol biopolymer transport system component